VSRHIQATLKDDVTVVRLRNHSRNNALTAACVDELRATLATVSSRFPPHAAVLAADGRNFCAGGDHAELATLNAGDLAAYIRNVVALLEDLLASPIPVVAAVQGGAVGGGVEVALRCDFVAAAEDAWFQLPQVELEGRIGTTTTALLVARVGLGQARRMILLGERISAAEAQHAGLVDVVVSRESLTDTAVNIAYRLAAKPPNSLHRARNTLAEVIIGRLQRQQDRTES
jgi:enoyl-CoA hydratase/carnithine racemase